MAAPDNQGTIVTFAVLSGLTPLIPVPFVDDMVFRYFKRHMVRRLAASHQASFSDDQVEALIGEADSGGFLSAALHYPKKAVMYPVKKTFRKVFYFLEWKRAADTVSRTYYQGYLIDYALMQGSLGTGSTHSPTQVREAIDRVLDRTDTRPIERTVASTFRGFKGLIGDAAGLITRQLSAKTVRGEEVEVAVTEAEQREQQRLSGVIDQVRKAIAAMPSEHFAAVRKSLNEELPR